MANTFKCDIVTPERAVFSELACYVGIPGTAGEMGVLAQHAPTVTTLSAGVVCIKRDESADVTDRFVVAGGYAQINGKQVTILADRACDLASIDADGVKANIADAESKLASLEQDDLQRKYLEDLLAWERTKQKALAG